MTHRDILLVIMGSLVPNNILAWVYQKLFRRHRPGRPRSHGFARLAILCGNAFGSPLNFTFWLLVVGAWLWSGSYFHYNNTWQLLINTPTTVIELFAAILIQYVGNRIERRQEDHEQQLLDQEAAILRVLREVQALAETIAANVEK